MAKKRKTKKISNSFEEAFNLLKDILSSDKPDLKKASKASDLLSGMINRNPRDTVFNLLLKLVKVDRKIDEEIEIVMTAINSAVYCIGSRLSLGGDEITKLIEEIQAKTKETLNKIEEEKEEVQEIEDWFSLEYKKRPKKKGKNKK